jgi:hypothetical protein
MDFHMAAVERDLTGRIAVAGNCLEYLLPNAALAPAREAIVDCLVRPVFARAVLPATADPLHVHDAAQNPTIILSLRAGLVLRQMRLDLRPLLVAKPKQIRAHRLGSHRLTKPLNQHMVN